MSVLCLAVLLLCAATDSAAKDKVSPEQATRPYPSIAHHPEGFFKDIFMDGGVSLSSRKRLPAAESLGLSYEHYAGKDAEKQQELFVGSDDGARANTTFVSLVASCKLHGIEPWAYLRDLFILIPSWPAQQAIDLAPVNWWKTLEREDVTHQLATNIYRMCTLVDELPVDTS